MNSIPISWIVVAGVLTIALLVLAIWVLSKRRKQSLRLQQRFGPEYSRTVDELGGRTKAESELKAREKRVGASTSRHWRHLRRSGSVRLGANCRVGLSITRRGLSCKRISWFVS